MRTCGLAATLVLLAAGSALAQYPGVGGGQQQQQQGSGSAGQDIFSPQQSLSCQTQFACIRWDWCYNGEVNTGGSGKLDVRTPPPVPADQSHLICPDGIASICCRIPDFIWIEQGGLIDGGGGGSGTGEWLGECYVHHACVPGIHCRDGVINTSGAGLLDPRISGTKCTIKDPDYLGELGVCCKFPDPVPQLVCSQGQQCVSEIACDGTIATSNVGYYTECYLDTIVGSVGVCCIPPTPAPLVTCPASQVCVDAPQCTPQGTVNTDGAGLIDPRFNLNCYLDTVTGDIGVCCNPPLEPPVDSCTTDGSFFCADTGTCLGQTLTDSYGRDLSCYVGGTSSLGQCCEAPLPVDSCSIGGTTDVCVAKYACFGSIIVNHYLNEKTCLLAKGDTGVCCTAPEPLKACATGYNCTLSELCQGDSTTIDSFPDCSISNHLVGKCCVPKLLPVDTLDTCPDASVCLPEFLCINGEILDIYDAYLPSTSLGEWKGCKISGTGLVSPGVCCRNPTVKEELPPPATQCGVRHLPLDTRISNIDPVNYQAQFAEFPWQAIIFFTNFTFKCGASLIYDEWLLTAAHCVDGYTPQDLRVRLGEWKVDSYEEAGQYFDGLIDDIIIHEHYKHSDRNLHNDIALLRLSQPVNFQYHINTVCLPNPGQVFYGQTRCYATGWGKDAFDGGKYQVTMKKVDLPLVPDDECVAILRTTRLGKFFKLHKSFVCAGGEVGKDSCEGDGGGPLVCQDPQTGRYVVSGITAWGVGCGAAIPGVYVDVQYFRHWIDNSILNAPTSGQQTAGNYGGK